MQYALLVLGFACLLLGGCAAPTATHLDVPSGQYATTFDAARDVLREYRFVLERVDAGQGVISTRPKHSAGFMTIWDSEQTSADQEIEDFMHNQRRVVRVTFEPAGAAPAVDAAPPVDVVPADSVNPPPPRLLPKLNLLRRPNRSICATTRSRRA